MQLTSGAEFQHAQIAAETPGLGVNIIHWFVVIETGESLRKSVCRDGGRGHGGRLPRSSSILG